MDKTKTFSKRKKFSTSISHTKNRRTIKLKENTGVKESNPTEELLNDNLISQAIWECLKEGDAEGVVEVIMAYLGAVNRTKIAKESALARSTLYHTLKSKNPTIKTLAKLVHAYAQKN